MYYGNIFLEVRTVFKACNAYFPESVFLEQFHVLVEGSLDLILHYLRIELVPECTELNSIIVFGNSHQLTCNLMDNEVRSVFGHGSVRLRRNNLKCICTGFDSGYFRDISHRHRIRQGNCFLNHISLSEGKVESLNIIAFHGTRDGESNRVGLRYQVQSPEL